MAAGKHDLEKPPDLRAQVRETVRARVAEIAFNLFAERGFEETTAAEAAAEAGISRASFFRYFASKEEAVYVAQETTGAKIAAAVAARPADEPTWVALHHGFHSAIEEYVQDPATALARVRLTREAPSLRAHQLERQAQWREQIGDAVADRLHGSTHDLRVEAVVAAAISALDVAASRWGDSDGSSDFVELLDEAFAAVREVED
jgi:AcrR family transcriptional regulator